MNVNRFSMIRMQVYVAYEVQGTNMNFFVTNKNLHW